MHPDTGTLFQRQVLPITLTLVVFGLLVGLVYAQVLFLNQFTTNDIGIIVRWPDLLIGLTVYLETSIDFAVFMGNLMHENPGWRNRISIEIGTALGNALGTMVVLFIWVLFKEVDWLLAIMITLAAVVLFKLAEEGLVHAVRSDREYPFFFREIVHGLEVFLMHLNWFTRPITRFIMPNVSLNAGPRSGFWSLFLFSITIPFVLGLDDFAGYVPLFSVVNVFSFTIGAFLAHALLNMFLYLSPTRTTNAVRNPIISFIGSLAFIGLAAWGIYEVLHLFVFH